MASRIYAAYQPKIWYPTDIVKRVELKALFAVVSQRKVRTESGPAILVRVSNEIAKPNRKILMPVFLNQSERECIKRKFGRKPHPNAYIWVMFNKEEYEFFHHGVRGPDMIPWHSGHLSWYNNKRKVRNKLILYKIPAPRLHKRR